MLPEESGPPPAPTFGFFSVDVIESNNANFAWHPFETVTPGEVEFRVLDSGIHSNRFYTDTGAGFVQDSDYAAGKPWTATPFIKTIAAVVRFVMIYPQGG